MPEDTYLGFDFGTKKIGIATGSFSTGIASPLCTLRNQNSQANWLELQKLIDEWQPVGFVVGISKQADGSDNPVTPWMQKFCRQLQGRFNKPVHQMDEQYSTFEAKQMLYDELGLSAKKLWGVQDQLAAQLILQSWFNHKTPK